MYAGFGIVSGREAIIPSLCSAVMSTHSFYVYVLSAEIALPGSTFRTNTRSEGAALLSLVMESLRKGDNAPIAPTDESFFEARFASNCYWFCPSLRAPTPAFLKRTSGGDAGPSGQVYNWVYR
jgi:hypothetical protein